MRINLLSFEGRETLRKVLIEEGAQEQGVIFHYHREITHAGIVEDDGTKTSLMRPLQGLKSKVVVTFTFATKEFVFYNLQGKLPTYHCESILFY